MDHKTQISLLLIGGWGVLLFITLARWFTIARNTLEPGLRNKRLSILQIRWFLGLSVGLVLLGNAATQMISKHGFQVPGYAWLGWSAILSVEIYFLVRFYLLRSNFRKYAPAMHAIDSTTSIIAFVGSFITFVAAA